MIDLLSNVKKWNKNMAVPKKKISKMRSRIRRTLYNLHGLGAPVLVCSVCKKLKRRHHYCAQCA